MNPGGIPAAVYASYLWHNYPTNFSPLHNSSPRLLHSSQTCYDVSGEKAEKKSPSFRVVSVQDACSELAITLASRPLRRMRTGDSDPLLHCQAVGSSLSGSERAGVDIDCQSYCSFRRMYYQGFACVTEDADWNRRH